MVFNYVKDYYIEGADRYSDATEGRTRISELEMLYKALRLAKRKRTRKKKKKKLPSGLQTIKMERTKFLSV